MKCGLCGSKVSVPAGSVEISLYSGKGFDSEDPQPVSVEDNDLCEKCFGVLSRVSFASLVRNAVASGRKKL